MRRHLIWRTMCRKGHDPRVVRCACVPSVAASIGREAMFVECSSGLPLGNRRQTRPVNGVLLGAAGYRGGEKSATPLRGWDLSSEVFLGRSCGGDFPI